MDLNDSLNRDDGDEDSAPLRELHLLAGGRCQGCGTGYDPHEVVFSVAMGFKSAPRCLPCLARGFDRPADSFRTELIEYVRRRECYFRAWREADRMSERTNHTANGAESPAASIDATEPVSEWDAGEMGCGELVLGLRIRLNALASGAALTVRATDPAAPEDLPSWCRLTGHTMVAAIHPNYTIRRK